MKTLHERLKPEFKEKLENVEMSKINQYHCKTVIDAFNMHYSFMGLTLSEVAYINELLTGKFELNIDFVRSIFHEV